MNWLPAHKAGLSLQHNEHRNYYQSALEWLIGQESFGGPSFDWVSPEEREKAIREDSIWVLHWYPDTPARLPRYRGAHHTTKAPESERIPTR